MIANQVPGGDGGAYGTVFQARDTVNNQLVAIKRIKSRSSPDIGIPVTVVRELSALRALRHQHVVTIKEVFMLDRQFHLVFELMSCNLRHYLQAFERHPTDQWVPIEDCQRIFRQVMSAVAFCHDRNIIHRDLKPDNILVDEGGQLVKVADFGMARIMHTRAHNYTENTVTAWYRPPEIMLGDTQYTEAVDVWSAACILIEMATLLPLFPCGSQWECLLGMFQLLGTPDSETWPRSAQLPHFTLNFPRWRGLPIEQCFRLGSSALPHKSDPDMVDLIQRMLVLDPDQRISAASAVDNHPFLRPGDNTPLGMECGTG